MLGPPSLLVVTLTTILILASAVHGQVSTRLRLGALFNWILRAMTIEEDKQAVGNRAWEALLVQAQANRLQAEANLMQAGANEATSRGLQCLTRSGPAPPFHYQECQGNPSWFSGPVCYWKADGCRV